ncbi:hypothetical protein [Methylobacterium sp. JK268]
MTDEDRILTVTRTPILPGYRLVTVSTRGSRDAIRFHIVRGDASRPEPGGGTSRDGASPKPARETPEASGATTSAWIAVDPCGRGTAPSQDRPHRSQKSTADLIADVLLLIFTVGASVICSRRGDFEGLGGSLVIACAYAWTVMMNLKSYRALLTGRGRRLSR